MDTRLREWSSFEYLDPVPVLRRLRSIELGLISLPAELNDVSERARRLRVNDLKGVREARDAAIFTHGMATYLGLQVFYAPVERSDYDFVTTCVVGDIQHFTPVQLKEVPPGDLAARASLTSVLNSLKKYSPTDSALAINYNRRERLDLSGLVLPEVPFREVWIFACTSADHSTWLLAGDFKASPGQIEFEYPE